MENDTKIARSSRLFVVGSSSRKCNLYHNLLSYYTILKFFEECLPTNTKFQISVMILFNSACCVFKKRGIHSTCYIYLLFSILWRILPIFYTILYSPTSSTNSSYSANKLSLLFLKHYEKNVYDLKKLCSTIKLKLDWDP